MKEMDQVYDIIIEAVKMAESNLDIESDLRNVVDKEKLEETLIEDEELQVMALKKVMNDGNPKG